MAVNGSSTLSAVKRQYDDNADYFVTPGAGGIAKAKLFLAAAMILMRRDFTSAAKGSNSLTRDSLKSTIKDCENWLLNRDPDLRAAPFYTAVDLRRMGRR
jgi:hypothetical protein